MNTSMGVDTQIVQLGRVLSLAHRMQLVASLTLRCILRCCLTEMMRLQV